MNTIVTSREEILKASRTLIQQNGWAAVNMRSVAVACGVSVGSIYNYFDSKTALVSAAVESVWNDIFHHPESGDAFQDTLSCIRWMYQQMEYGCKQYPGFFAHHSLVFIQHGMTGGKEKMHEAWQHILSSLCDVLKNDSHVREDAFNQQFTPEKFAGILFSLMLSALVRQDFDPSAVLEVVRRTLYEGNSE